MQFVSNANEEVLSKNVVIKVAQMPKYKHIVDEITKNDNNK